MAAFSQIPSKHNCCRRNITTGLTGDGCTVFRRGCRLPTLLGVKNTGNQLFKNL
jgi:hypothetical protein